MKTLKTSQLSALPFSPFGEAGSPLRGLGIFLWQLVKKQDLKFSKEMVLNANITGVLMTVNL